MTSLKLLKQSCAIKNESDHKHKMYCFPEVYTRIKLAIQTIGYPDVSFVFLVYDAILCVSICLTNKENVFRWKWKSNFVLKL